MKIMEKLTTKRGRPSEDVYTVKGMEELESFKKRLYISIARGFLNEDTFQKISYHLSAIYALLKDTTDK
jgi:hypothetical protein